MPISQFQESHVRNQDSVIEQKLTSTEHINHRLGHKAMLRAECDGLVGPDPQIWIKDDQPFVNERHRQSKSRINKPEGHRSER